MLESGIKQQIVNIPYLEGVNSLVSFNMGKKTEFVHAENARSKVIGTIEKREGQTVLGKNSLDLPFATTANYGLFSLPNNTNKGFYRISVADSTTAEMNVNVVDRIQMFEEGNPSDISLFVSDNLSISEQVNELPGNLVTIYYINSNNQWIPLTGSGAGIPGGAFDYTNAEGSVFLVNLNSENRYISPDGTTVTTALSGAGHLFNTPPASRVNYYKNKIYLADFVRSGTRYKTTVLRSSAPMGIIALVNEDVTVTMDNDRIALPSTAADINIAVADTILTREEINGVAPSDSYFRLNYSTGAASIDVTDTKYFYTDTGANMYDIYRGQSLIATMEVTNINNTSIEVIMTADGTLTSMDLLASDEIWISGTYDGPKVFRWVNNPTITGKDIKQYDTFKLSGGDNDAITMLTNIGNVMIISNRSAMASWNDYTLENFDLDIGCVSKRGYVKVLGTLFFLHYTGIYATSGTTPKLLSNKVERYITGATRIGKEASAAGKKGRSIFFTLGDVTLYKADGSIDKILRDACLEYNLTQENWFVHKNVKASEFATFIEEIDSDRLEFTDTSGNHAVKEFLSGETDDGDEIDMRVDTMKLTMQPMFDRTNNPIGISAEIERGSAIQVFVNLENGEEYYPIDGTLTKGLSIVKITDKDASRGKPPACRLISISLRDSSKQLCKISRLNLIYTPTTDEIPDNKD